MISSSSLHQKTLGNHMLLTRINKLNIMGISMEDLGLSF